MCAHDVSSCSITVVITQFYIKFVGIVCAHSSAKLLGKVINDRIDFIKPYVTISDSAIYNFPKGELNLLH